jgi:small-conductance mechanosensitive channel
MERLLSNLPNLLWAAGLISGATGGALIAHGLLFRMIARFAERSHNRFDAAIVTYLRRPCAWIFPWAAIFAVLPSTPLPTVVLTPIRHLVLLILIASFAWIALEMVNALEEWVTSGAENSATGRRVRTQALVLHRLFSMVVGVITVGAMLMTFPSIWHVGAGLFASAGAAGLIVGMAARPAISSLLAGVQIAVTNLIHVDDVVIVEGEWGTVEEINSTYVVVRCWDLRRLVLPLSYFTEHPFQDWTRKSSDLLGTVFLYADYTVSVDDVRAELTRVLKSTPLWDGKVNGLQVTNATDRSMELRALMSASNANNLWDLRCLVREKLIALLQSQPGHLPKLRSEVLPLSAGVVGAAMDPRETHEFTS